MTRLHSINPTAERNSVLPWLFIIAGFCAVYIPSFIDLFHGVWGTEKNAHGPIVMTVAFCFFFFRVRQLYQANELSRSPAPVIGGTFFLIGLIAFSLGRSQNVLFLEVGSIIWVTSALVLFFFGISVWRKLWFVFFFMLFMIPLPASLVDAVTLPLKIAVSYATEHILYWAGYPIGRSGVILLIGQYQLLVADACAGLNSLFTLEALGLLYMNLVRHSSVIRNVVLATLIVPISFCANTLRIIFLALITFYWGDDAGQGFLHGFSGMVLFLSALLLIISVDKALTWLVTRYSGSSATTPLSMPVHQSINSNWKRLIDIGWVPAGAISMAFFLTVGVAAYMTPTLVMSQPVTQLEKIIPTAFGEWHEVKANSIQANLSVANDGERTLSQPYDDVLLRTYANKDGEQVMLALAYAREQRQDVKIHLPEICYPAQGFRVSNLAAHLFEVGHKESKIVGKTLIATGESRKEAVSYWVRIGDEYLQDGLSMRLKILRDGLDGYVSDGMLVRASMLVGSDADAIRSFEIQDKFLKQLLDSVDRRSARLVAERS